MGINCLEGIYQGVYWSDYFPGPFINVEAKKFDPWLMGAEFCNFLDTLTSRLTIWLVSYKFYKSASQLKIIEAIQE